MIYTLVTRDLQTITLDSITNVSESYSAKATSHPVERGAPITDHIVLENNKFSISGVVSDYNIVNPNTNNFVGLPVTFSASTNTFQGGWVDVESSIERVKALLIKTLKDRDFVSFTRTDVKNNILEEHKHCVIVGLSFSDDPDSGEAIYPKIELEEIRLADLRTEASKTIPQAIKAESEVASDAKAANGTTSSGDGKGLLTPEESFLEWKIRTKNDENNAQALANYEKRKQLGDVKKASDPVVVPPKPTIAPRSPLLPPLESSKTVPTEQPNMKPPLPAYFRS